MMLDIFSEFIRRGRILQFLHRIAPITSHFSVKIEVRNLHFFLEAVLIQQRFRYVLQHSRGQSSEARKEE